MSCRCGRLATKTHLSSTTEPSPPPHIGHNGRVDDSGRCSRRGALSRRAEERPPVAHERSSTRRRHGWSGEVRRGARRSRRRVGERPRCSRRWAARLTTSVAVHPRRAWRREAPAAHQIANARRRLERRSPCRARSAHKIKRQLVNGNKFRPGRHAAWAPSSGGRRSHLHRCYRLWGAWEGGGGDGHIIVVLFCDVCVLCSARVCCLGACVRQKNRCTFRLCCPCFGDAPKYRWRFHLCNGFWIPIPSHVILAGRQKKH